MKILPFLLLAMLLVGCTETVVFPVEANLSHQEVVDRIKKLLKEVSMAPSDALFLIEPSEKQVAENITKLTYQHLAPQPPPNLYTPAVSYDWTVIEVDTSTEEHVKLSVRTYRRGNFIDGRQKEVEAELIQRLQELKNRANKSLQPMSLPTLRSSGAAAKLIR